MNRISKVIDKRNALLIFCVLVGAIVIGVLVPYLRYSNPSSSNTNTGNAEVEVKYTKQGFDPKTITVPVGTTVAWRNVSGQHMWVGSDPHPSHTDLKGFDQLRILMNDIKEIFSPEYGIAYAHGEGVYEYTFMSVGTWTYHNHMFPEHRGTIIVVDK